MTQTETGPRSVLKGLFRRKLRGSESPEIPASSSPSSSPTPSQAISRVNSSSSLTSLTSVTSVNTKGYGKKIGNIGSGITARVDLYHHKSSNTLYAIKTFHARESYESKQEYKSRCVKEYDVMKDLSHPNIVQAYDFINGFQSLQLVLEYAPYSLLKLIQFTKPGEEEVLCFFRQVCEGVLYLHDHWISHRDLKMENLVIDETATVKIIDFGTAFRFGQQRDLATGNVGTEGLVSPEALSSIKYDPEANEIWGLGILLYSMINLSFPWKAARDSDLEYKAFKVDNEVIRDKVPDQFWNLMTLMLEIDEFKRIRTKQLTEVVRLMVKVHSSCEVKLHRRTIKVCSTKKEGILT